MRKYHISMFMLLLIMARNTYALGPTGHGAKGLLEGSLATLGGIATFCVATELKRSACALSRSSYLRNIHHREILVDSFVTLSALAVLGYATWTLGSSCKSSLLIFFEGNTARKFQEK
jgi:hypothetical protein